jgi:hypothetical protein
VVSYGGAFGSTLPSRRQCALAVISGTIF